MWDIRILANFRNVNNFGQGVLTWVILISYKHIHPNAISNTLNTTLFLCQTYRITLCAQFTFMDAQCIVFYGIVLI